MRTIMQRCSNCGQWLDIAHDEQGQSVICTCGHVNTITDKNQKNEVSPDMFAPVPIAGKPAETTADFIKQHFIFCTVKR